MQSHASSLLRQAVKVAASLGTPEDRRLAEKYAQGIETLIGRLEPQQEDVVVNFAMPKGAEEEKTP